MATEPNQNELSELDKAKAELAEPVVMETAAEATSQTSQLLPPRSTGSGDATGPANPLPADTPDSSAMETPTTPTPSRDRFQPPKLTADERQKVVDSIESTYRGLQFATEPTITTECEAELFSGSAEQCSQFARANRFNEQLSDLRIVDYPGHPCRVFGVKKPPQ